MKITKEFKFEAAHRLPNHEWKCKNIHWHNYKVIVEIDSDKVYEDCNWVWRSWMIIDFWDLKKIKEWLDWNRDHTYIYKEWDEIWEILKEKWYKTCLFSVSPTAENMCKYLKDIVKDILINYCWLIENEFTVWITIFENDNCSASI